MSSQHLSRRSRTTGTASSAEWRTCCCWCWEITAGKEVCFLMPSKASPAGRNPEMENSSEPSSPLAVLKDMNAGAPLPDLAGNCHCAASVAPK